MPNNTEDDRHFMQRAIEEAAKSVAEDDRAHPFVGAVCVKDGKIIGTAHRGTNPGWHAEHYLLAEVLKDQDLTGATLYVTLEPCTSRGPHKTPCVTQIIESGITNVFIGMLDPNPAIQGHGQRILQEHDIAVNSFHQGLANEVNQQNMDFRKQWELPGPYVMRLGVLSSTLRKYNRQDINFDFVYEDRRLQEVARDVGIELHLLDPLKVTLVMSEEDEGSPLRLRYHDPEEEENVLHKIEALLVRSRGGALLQQIYDIALAFTIANPKMTLFDPIEAYGAYGKSAGSLLRAAQRIAQPYTVVSFGSEDHLGGAYSIVSNEAYPILSKGQYGARGEDIKRIQNPAGLSMQMNKDAEYGLFLQSDLRMKHGADVREFRVIVIGGEAIGAAERIFPNQNILDGNWNSADATFIKADLTPELKSLAEEASKASYHSFSGLDILQLPDGNYTVLECNRNPQFKKFDGALGENVAKKILEHLTTRHL